MFKLIMLIKKRPDMSRDAFIDYYDNHHVPLVHSILPMGAAIHRRNYPLGADAEYAVISEVFYEDQQTATAAAAKLAEPETAAIILADEDRFILRGSIKRFIVETHETKYREV
jgi:hypothetical protein